MVAYPLIVYFVSLFALMFFYTLTWDLFMGFMEMALAAGGVMLWCLDTCIPCTPGYRLRS